MSVNRPRSNRSTEDQSPASDSAEAIPSKPTALAVVRRRPARGKRLSGNNRTTPTAFLYLRVSTKEQARGGGSAEGYSIPAQRQASYDKARALGAVIVTEYVDAGESAKTAHRPDLQRMLADIRKQRPDYVIVHKIDRLARNRADDIAINLQLQRYGARLISCTENIDDTPQGKLLYGLLAEIAQFYSGNLAQEVLKGLTRKAQEGGTPFRAPIGYLNHREARDGIEHSWVEPDPERADLVRWCIEEYATGAWTVNDLTLAAREKGLTNRATATQPERPIGPSGMHHLLQNPYYMGVISYRGMHYEGRHPRLVEPEVWLAVQDVLAAHAHAGEKDRTHPHYLRGSIFCSDCGGRLVYSEQKGNGGTYAYFWCVKRKTKANNCHRRAMRVERVEDAIIDFYADMTLSPERIEQIQTSVRAELATQQREAARRARRATRRRTQVEGQRQKLLEAHYAGAIPPDLLASEMKRLTRALAEADAEIAAANTRLSDVEHTLTLALRAAEHVSSEYAAAPPAVRRQINQGFFHKIYIGEDGTVERVDFTEPFARLLPQQTQTATSDDLESDPASCVFGDQDDITNRQAASRVFQSTRLYTGITTPGREPSGRGVKQTYLVELRGFEPLTPSMRTRCATGLRHSPERPSG
jgi:site-specific DNA recombinase